MSFTVLIEELAEKEIDDAFLWYELQKEGLGFEFIDIINQSISNIESYPLSCSISHKDLRKYIINRFPYSIFFSIDNEFICIIAILHNRRNPEILSGRLGN